MRQGDLSIVSSALHFALKTLRQHWDQTGEVWRVSPSAEWSKLTEGLPPIQAVIAF